MVPIHQIMREIKVAFGTNDVCLPKNTNEFRIRIPRQEPHSETKIDPGGDENSLTILPPPTQSIRTTDDLNKMTTDSDTLSPQIQQDSLICPTPNPSAHPYRMILSKMKEESEQVSTIARTNPPSNALRSTTAGDINTAFVLYDTLPGQQDPESYVPSAQVEPKPSASQPTVSQERAREPRHRPATDIADEIKRPSMFMLGSSSGDNESSVKDWRSCETEQSSLANSWKNEHLNRSKKPSFKETIQSSRTEEADCNSDVSKGVINKEGEAAWENSESESRQASPVDNNISQRVESQASLTSQWSMLTMQLHNPQRNISLSDGSWRSSPTLHQSCTSPSTDPSHSDGKTALHRAAARGHETVVRLLLENGAGVDVQNKYGATALHRAAAHGHETVVRLLLENGAGVGVWDKFGAMALHRAATNGHEMIVRLLLKNGVSVDVQDKFGTTALYWAAAHGHETVVRLLLKNGAGVDFQYKGGETALRGAVTNGHEAVGRLLLENCAGVDGQDKYGAQRSRQPVGVVRRPFLPMGNDSLSVIHV
jgi:ankyrin repeat protein